MIVSSANSASGCTTFLGSLLVGFLYYFHVQHHPQVIVLQVVTMQREDSPVLIEPDQHLDRLQWHHQYGVFPAALVGED